MQNNKRPYIVIPYFVEQPTWGGRYILRAKGWDDRAHFTGIKIGQSYELFSKSRLATVLNTTTDGTFTADSAHQRATVEACPIEAVEPAITLPLIKFTQSKGNSFQLHKRPESDDPHWQPKAESWYYFEPGKVSFGIKKGADIQQYKDCCVRINSEMQLLSSAVKSSKITVEDARKKANEIIQFENPWQFVNVHYVPSDGIVDLSGGGLHHSWEEDTEKCPLGNVVYEVQQDVMDPVSTIRSFDQGKIMDDGSIRTIHIDDYFKHLDTDENRNTLSLSSGNTELLFNSPHYKLKKLLVEKETKVRTDDSFHHLFIKSGSVEISGGGVTVFVGSGHSCFIPSHAEYSMKPKLKSVILQTFM